MAFKAFDDGVYVIWVQQRLEFGAGLLRVLQGIAYGLVGRVVQPGDGYINGSGKTFNVRTGRRGVEESRAGGKGQHVSIPMTRLAKMMGGGAEGNGNGGCHCDVFVGM